MSRYDDKTCAERLASVSLWTFVLCVCFYIGSIILCVCAYIGSMILCVVK